MLRLHYASWRNGTVAAGKFELTKDRRGNALGRFVYGKSYLARSNAVAIDPIELSSRVRHTKPCA